MKPLALALLLLCCATVASAADTTRWPVPADTAVVQAKELIASVYKRDYEAAKTSAQKQSLAKKMLEDAVKSDDDAAVRFALQQVARKIATGIGDVELAVSAADATAQSFDVLAGEIQLEVFREVAATVKGAVDVQILSRYISREMRRLIVSDQYELAEKLVDIALVAARQAGDAELAKQWVRRQDELKLHSMAYVEATAAREILKSSPADPTANGSVGKFLAVNKQDWMKGLPMLALGNDEPLQRLAERELKGTNSPMDELALTDNWYDLAQQRDGLERLAILIHARKRYERVLPGLAALPQRRVQQRIDELRAATSPFSKDEWVEILDYVELPKHQVENAWRHEGLAIVAAQREHCKVFKIPVIASGSYEMRVRAARLVGDNGVMVSLSQPTNDVEFWLNSPSGGSGLQLIDGKASFENKSRADAKVLVDGRPFLLNFQVDRRDDKVNVRVTFDNQPYIRWSGNASSLVRVQDRWRDAIHIGTCHSTCAIYSVQLKVKSGTAWVTD